MKTTKQVIKETGHSAKLVNAVVNAVGIDYMEDLANHGASGGFPGITYCTDTLAFFRKHKSDILRLAENLAADLGEDMLVMIAGFNCLKNDKLTGWQVSQAINGKGDDSTNVQNALCWFACEEIARAFVD